MVGLNHDAIKWVIAGTIGGVQDWSTGIWFDVSLTSGSWALTDQQAFTDEFRSSAIDWWATLHGLCAADTTMTKTTTYFYPAHAVNALSVAESIIPSPVAGTGTTYLPTQSALVASMRTAVAGKSGRGRSYFPINGQALGSDHQLSGATCGTVANAYALMLTTLNGLNETANGITGQTASVASFTKGQLNTIRTVIVDSKIDTQRRREDKTPTTAFRSATV